jgi:ubiquinone biosynthesis protein
MRFWANLRRIARIMRVLVWHLLAHAVTHFLVRWEWLSERLAIQPVAGPDRVRACFEDLGGTFIKFGQMLALQPDILPREYCNALFNLLDRVTPFGYAEVERIFAEEFGKQPSEIFDSFDTKEIATASVGQVYVAYLDKRKVAVKVQRPTVETDFAGDIRLMSATIRMIKGLRLKKIYWMVEPMSEFVSWTYEELDYRYEARYLSQQRRNTESNLRERIPVVFWEYTTRRVLTIEFLDGVTVMDYIRVLEGSEGAKLTVLQKVQDMEFNPNRFARNIIDNFLGDAFQYGMFHADLHPANLMILPRNVVGYIDFGITGVLSPYLRRHLVMLTLAYSRGDLDAMCAAFFKVSVLGKDSSVEVFRNELENMAADWYGMVGKERRMEKNITLVMLDLLHLSRKTNIWPERDVIKYIRSSIAVDGLITRFAPGFDVGRYLETVCDRYLKWYTRQELFAFDSLVDLSSSSGHLIRDGALRASTVLQRLVAGDFSSGTGASTNDASSEGDEEPLRMKAVSMATIVFSVSLLIVVTGETVQFGVNLFTAELLLISAAMTILLQTLRRLVF